MRPPARTVRLGPVPGDACVIGREVPNVRQYPNVPVRCRAPSVQRAQHLYGTELNRVGRHRQKGLQFRSGQTRAL